jgi:hypothetical protein
VADSCELGNEILARKMFGISWVAERLTFSTGVKLGL